jgi:hypothetical protein
MFRVEAAIALHNLLVNQPGVTILYIIDQKTFGVTEVLIDLPAILGCDCDQHASPPLLNP